MKKVLIVISMLIVTLITACTTKNVSNDMNNKIRLKFSILENEEHGQALMAKAFKKEIEKLSNGDITVDLFFNASLYNQDGAIAAIRTGELEMTNLSIQTTSEYYPPIAMFASDYIFKDYTHMRKVMDSKIGEELAIKIKERAGYYPIGYYYNGSRQLNLKKETPVKTPEDLKGVILRMATSKAWLDAGNALGATATPLSYNEVYNALSSGTIDAQDNPMPATKIMKFYEVTKQICLTHHIIDCGLLSISGQIWDKLNEEQKTIMKAAAKIAIEVCDNAINKSEDELVEFFKKEGLVISRPDIEAFQTYAQNYYKTNNLIADWDMDLFEEVQKMGE